MIKVNSGLNIPIKGLPSPKITRATPSKRVAIVGSDFIGLKPGMRVEVGSRVRIGDPLFIDKKNEDAVYTSPAAGIVEAINRGDKRSFLSLTIKVDEKEEALSFDTYSDDDVLKMDRNDLCQHLIKSGHWTSLKERPFGKVPKSSTNPHSLYVRVMDTNPLAPSVGAIIGPHIKEFRLGILALSKLTEGKTYICKSPEIDLENFSDDNIEIKDFVGPHPSGNWGTHIQYLSPLDSEHRYWGINYQEVIAIGSLLQTGRIFTDRYVALSGPGAKNPRILLTRLGANLENLVTDELIPGATRVISGSVLDGRKSENGTNFLGRFHHQVCALDDVVEREFLGWQKPGFNKYSVLRVFASKLLPKKYFPFSTDTHGSLRAIVPVAPYDTVLPMDTEPVYLLRALLSEDTDLAQKLGVLEMEEEDIALCTFICPSKIDYGPLLRKCLTTIEKEG